MRDPVIKVYEPGNKNKFKITNTDHPLIDEIAASETLFQSSDMSSETLLTNYLHTNPFLYNPQINNIKVHSIEDFIISVKREQIALGDLIRNPKYTPKQRKKYINKAFKTWKKEYILKKNTAFRENDKVVEVIGEISYLEYSWKAKLIIIISFILLLLFVVTDSIIWNSFKQGSFGYSLYISIVNMYNNMSWLKVVGNLGIYLTLILIFYSGIYSFIIKDFKKNYKLAQSFLSNSEGSISREFNKKYRKSRRYYLKRVNNKKYPYFPPLGIEEVQEGKMNITIFNEICKATIDRAYIVKKTKPYITAFKVILQISGIACLVVILGMSLYSIFITLFL